MISFSTCWNSHRHTEGDAMIEEIVSLGFTTIELSHGMNISLYPGILKAFERGIFQVSGVHNYFPSPVEVMIDAPDCYEFSADRPFERDRALKLTLETLNNAAKFGAKYVVLHMGSVPMDKFTKVLTRMVKDGEIHSRDYVKKKLEFVKTREKKGPKYFQRSMEALRKIAEHAEKVGVPVAVESRSKYEDVPSEREMVELQDEFADNPWVGYWHDFGHVQLKHNLGLLDHREWLTKMQPHLIGCHLHDVVWPARDHRVPLYGSIQYDKLIPLVSSEKPMVWELSPRRPEEQIRDAHPRWIEKYGA